MLWLLLAAILWYAWSEPRRRAKWTWVDPDFGKQRLWLMEFRR